MLLDYTLPDTACKSLRARAPETSNHDNHVKLQNLKKTEVYLEAVKYLKSVLSKEKE